MKKVSLLGFAWIALRSVGVTFVASTKALWLSLRGKNDRAAIDALARSWSQKLIDIIDLKYRVVGEMPHYETGRRYIIMCSHASHYDIPLSFVALPGSIRMLAKNELSRIPIFGRAMLHSEFIFIDRHNREQALKDLDAARRKMEEGIVLWVAPEGTRSTDGKLLSFKKGCFHLALDTGALIIPIGIRDIVNVLPKGTTDMYTGVHVEMHIGNFIDAGNYTMQTRDRLMNEVETEMRRLLNQPK
jgi:1-acyl-sn-glycerol-3-phosphate acyltransferase